MTGGSGDLKLKLLVALRELVASDPISVRLRRVASDNRSSVVNLSRPIALAPRTRCRSRRMPRVAEAWDRSTAPGATSRSTISSASVRLQRLRLACRSGARLIPILATRHGRARPGLLPFSTARASNSSCSDNCSVSASRISGSSSTMRILRVFGIQCISRSRSATSFFRRALSASPPLC